MLVGALLAAQLYLLLRDLRFDRRVALLAVGGTAFVHPIFTYTTQVYPDLKTPCTRITPVLASVQGPEMAGVFHDSDNGCSERESAAGIAPARGDAADVC